MSANFPKVNMQGLIGYFNSLDIKARYTIFAVCVGAVVALDYFLLIRLQLQWMAAADTAIQSVAADTARVKSDVQRVGQIKQNLEISRAELESVNSKIRSMEEVPAILEEISRTANEFHVNIEQLAPVKAEKEALLAGAGSQYYSLPIVITAHSGYHMFGHFLNKLESGNLLFMLRDLRVEQGAQAAGDLTIQATLKIIVTDHPPAEVPK